MPPETETTKPKKAKTRYRVLREVKKDGPLVEHYEPVVANLEANNAEHALRLYAASPGAETGVYVAITDRAFKPTKITLTQTTAIKVG